MSETCKRTFASWKTENGVLIKRAAHLRTRCVKRSTYGLCGHACLTTCKKKTENKKIYCKIIKFGCIISLCIKLQQ
ncbi:hypothetical protein PUN28_008090 [Cardiocondyla obscurior]|uniref:Uncharacterized protein n=1 Tax=Cardiocondyla obscurior TaxID=286306 RepID=A0AAW2FY78_9HYME